MNPTPIISATKFMLLLGTQQVVQDIRKWWAREDREDVGWDRLSKAEKRLRNTFAFRVTTGMDPATAAREVLQLDVGPIPEYETKDGFDIFWSRNHLAEIAARWTASPYFRSYARRALERAHNMLAASAPMFAQVLVDAASDENAPRSSRVKASHIGIRLAGLIPGKTLAPDLKGAKEQLRAQGRRILEIVPDKELEPTGTDPQDPYSPGAGPEAGGGDDV